MAKPKVFVGQVKNLSQPQRVRATGVRTTRATPAAAEHTTVDIDGGQVKLNAADAKSAAYKGVLESIRKTKSAVYVETDAKNVVTRILVPLAEKVVSIAPKAVDGRQEITLKMSSARHYLNTAHPSFKQLLEDLRKARDHDLPVLVTETMSSHEIIDVRPNPNPFEPRLASAVRAAGRATVRAVAAPISMAEATKQFDFLAGQKHIPFQYPDDGCWGRAHEMFRLLTERKIQSEKAWIYGDLKVRTKNSPDCSVSWRYHVAPTVMVSVNRKSTPYIIDPSIFTAPKVVEDWKTIQHDDDAELVSSAGAVFFRSEGGHLDYDANFSQTKSVLATYRHQLELRIAEEGAPPYANC